MSKDDLNVSGQGQLVPQQPCIVPHDTVIDELKALAKKQDIDDENLAVAMAVYMLGFGSYRGF